MTSMPFIIWRTKNSLKKILGQVGMSVRNTKRPDTCAEGIDLGAYVFNMSELSLISAQT